MSPRAVELIAWALAHSLWQATAAAALFALVDALAPVRKARLRYAAGLLTLCAQLAAPVLTLLVLARTAAPPPSVLGPSAGGGDGLRVAYWTASVWALGAAMMGLRLLLGVAGARRLILRAEPLPTAWTAQLEALCERLRVRRKVRWLASRFLDVPLTVGSLRPVVLIPLSALTGMPPQTLELLATHELLHVRRFDYLFNLLQSAIEVVLFFHPAVWWVSRCVRAEREACCDDGVVRAGADPLAYARALATLEQQRRAELVLSSNGGALMWRIQRLMQSGAGRQSYVSSWGVLAALVGLASAGLVLAAAPSARLSSRWLPPALEPYRGAIEAAAARHQVDADLLAVMVLAESAADARAKSPYGARGLMQLMPKTAERVAAARQLPFSVAQLEDPAFNVDLGAAYLAQQLSRFERAADPTALAVAAYNAGPERAQAWSEGREPLSTETDRYQQLVLGMWRERGGERSSAYEAWRERQRTKAADRAVAPVAVSKVTLPFGTQPNPFDGKPYAHSGVDIAAPTGTSVLAPLDGVVEEVSSDAERGTVVVLSHGGGFKTRYHHLGGVQVRAEQPVRKGEAFATVGATGKVTGPHVHFEVLDLGQAFDPAPFLR